MRESVDVGEGSLMEDNYDGFQGKKEEPKAEEAKVISDNFMD